jgi:uncharacterized paraquat-inducible protein A
VITLNCVRCRRAVTLPDDYPSSAAKCPGCGQLNAVHHEAPPRRGFGALFLGVLMMALWAGASTLGFWVGVRYLIALQHAEGAPQQAALASMTAAELIALYVVMRGIDKVARWMRDTFA